MKVVLVCLIRVILFAFYHVFKGVHFALAALVCEQTYGLLRVTRREGRFGMSDTGHCLDFLVR